MEIDIKQLMQYILSLGSVSGLLVLPYTIVHASKRRPRLKFDFSYTSRSEVREDNEYGDCCCLTFSGTIKNRSSDTNSISKIYLVVWVDNKKRNSVFRLSFGGILLDEKEKKLTLPLELPPRTGKMMQIYFKIPVTGTSDERLLKEHLPDVYNLPKYRYELCFEDTDENFFDQQGRLRNLEEINLRWTLPNTMQEMQKGNFVPFLKYMFQIQKSKVFFLLKRISYHVGL